jgi:hypothetical protein
MPTGYTADVATGKVTDFNTFAMQCARAFGACITMRDDPSDTPIPEEFVPSQWNNERLEETLKELHELESASDDEIAEMAHKDFVEKHDRWVTRRREREEQRKRYESMLSDVLEWSPPSQDHDKFKEFMAEQLRESIRFDCSGSYDDEPRELSANVWKHNRKTSLRQDVTYHKEHQAEENARTATRNEWIKLLRVSLREPSHVQ